MARPRAGSRANVVEIAAARAGEPSTDGLSQAIDTWLSALSSERGASRHTLDGYGCDVRVFLRWLTNHLGRRPALGDLADLTRVDFREWLAARHSAGAGTSSRARSVSAVKSLFRHLDDDGEGPVANRAIAGLRAPRRVKSLPRPLPLDQVEILIQAVADANRFKWAGLRDQAVLTLLYGSGLRIGEALLLDRHQAPALPTPGPLRVHGKGNKFRLVPVPVVAAAAVAAYLNACPFELGPTDPLFVSISGRRLQSPSLQARLRTLRATLGLPPGATPHALRHSFATHVFAGSHDLRAVQLLLGHSSVATTERYVGVEISALHRLHEASHPWGPPPAEAALVLTQN